MKRSIAIGGVVAAGVALAGLLPAGAASAAPHAVSAGDVVVARVNGNHLSLSSGRTINAGHVTFEVVSKDGKDHTLQVARLHKGYTLRQLQTDANAAFSGDTTAIRRLDSRVTFRGGAEARHYVGWFSTALGPGRYLLFDQNGTAHRWLTVVRPRRHAAAPATTGTITAYSYGFGTSGRLPAKGWVRLYNQSDQPHFFVFQRVKEGTTRAQVKKAFSPSNHSKPSFALKANTSAGVITPYRGEQMYLPLPAGEYVVACFWPDDDSGMPHAFMGMWDIVHLT